MRIPLMKKYSSTDIRYPSLRANAGCPRSREGTALVMDCGSCEGKQDLLDKECLRSVLKSLSSEPGIEEVILSGEWDVSYGDECVRALCSMATVVRLCLDLSTISPGRKSCSACPFSSKTLYSSISNDLFSLPDEQYLSSCARQYGRGKKVCNDCIQRAGSNISQIRDCLEKIGMDVTRSAFGVVEAGHEASIGGTTNG